jgi:hypothetical protein
VYARIIAVTDDTDRKFFLIASDTSLTPGQRRLEKQLYEQYGRQTGIVITTTHDHQTLWAGDREDNPADMPYNPILEEYTDLIHAQILRGIEEALCRKEPAQMGIGEIDSMIGACRDYCTPGGTIQASDLHADTDNELTLVKFARMDGSPIAVYASYGMHGNFMLTHLLNGNYPMLGGDLPGAITEYAENAIGGGCIVAWGQGASGDRNPLIQSNLTYFETANGKYGQQNKILSVEDSLTLMRYLASIQGEEISQLQQKITDYTREFHSKTADFETEVELKTSFRDLKIPQPAAGDHPTVVPNGTEPMLFHLVIFNDIAFAGINAEMYSMLGKHVREALPFRKTIIIGLCRGNRLGYIPDAGAIDKYGFGTYASIIRDPGKTEQDIIRTFVALSQQDCMQEQ